MISESYNVDCVKFMLSLPDKSFELGSADPPYGIGESSKNHKSRNTPVKQKNGKVMKCRQPEYGNDDWDNSIPDDLYFLELKRTTINQVIWGANYFPQVVDTPFKAPRREMYQEFIKQHPVGWIIWDKVNGTSDFSDCELAWTSFNRPTTVFYYMWAGMMQGVSMEQGLVAKGNKALNEIRIHPTQKPIELYRWLFTTYPVKNILSTHAGSQSDRIVAYKMGIDFVCTELSERHFNDGNKRFKKLTYEPLFFNK